MIRYKSFNRAERLLRAIAVSLSLGITCSQAWADDATGDTPLQLREIMQELGYNMQRTIGAISLEDWEQVAKLAEKIAAHPQPPLSERMRILAYLGSDSARFKGFDEQVHQAAHVMGEAAQRGDGKAVIQSFAKVQESCLACHQSFRMPLVEHFYGKR